MTEEDPQMWNHLPKTSTSEITYNWKRQAAGRDRAAPATATTVQMPLSLCRYLFLTLLWWVLADSGRALEGEKIHGSPRGGQLGFVLASPMTSSLTVSLCWNILENYPRQISGIHGPGRDFFFFSTKDIPLRASLTIDSSEEISSWGNADGGWKLNPGSAIFIWWTWMGTVPQVSPQVSNV